MKANSTRESAPKNDHIKPLTDMAETAMKNYEQAVRTGLKFQEEAGKWWGSVFNQGTLAQDWQKRFNNVTGMANTLLPLAQKRMEEVMTLVEKNGRTGAELMKKAVDAAQTPVIAESQAKWLEFWTSSMRAAQAQTEALTQINARMLDSWVDFIRSNIEMTETQATRAA